MSALQALEGIQAILCTRTKVCKMCKREDIFVFVFIECFLNCLSFRVHKAEVSLCCKWPLRLGLISEWVRSCFNCKDTGQNSIRVFSGPRSKLSKVLNSGKQSPFGVDKTLIAAGRVIDSGMSGIFMPIYNFVGKSLDLSKHQPLLCAGVREALERL